MIPLLCMLVLMAQCIKQQGRPYPPTVPCTYSALDLPPFLGTLQPVRRKEKQTYM